MRKIPNINTHIFKQPNLPWATVSEEAQYVLDRMTGLTAIEETAIINFVDQENDDGNWGLYDEFFCFALGGANALVGFKTKTATNNGATFDVNGANTVAGFINSNYNPSVDGVNWQLLDAMFGMFFKVSDKRGVQNGNGALTGESTLIRDFESSANLTGFINGNSRKAEDLGNNINDNELIVLSRKSVSENIFYRDGTSSGNTSLGVDPDTVTNADLYIGQANGGDDYQGTISSFIVGASIGFDQVQHNLNLRAFLTELGTL